MDRVACEFQPPPPANVTVIDEWALELKREDQILLHFDHHTRNRDKTSARYWFSNEYPLHDRKRLRQLLEEVDVRMIDPAAITKKMPSPRK